MAEDGDRLGPYRILRPIGRGGQATVYLAEDTRLHRQVALKVLDPGHHADPKVLERFRREAEITSKLDHPAICQVYELGEDRGALWIAMRYVEGESLAKMVAAAQAGGREKQSSPTEIPEKAGPSPQALEGGDAEPPSGPRTSAEIERVLSLFEKVARALHVAHEHGVIHRDIKPGNIMVTPEGDPVLLDFGLAQEIEGSQMTLTLTGDLMGTPHYMSPEQIAAQRIRLDRRTDVYSLGVTLFECLTLCRPFDAPTRDGLYRAILTKDPPNVRALNPEVPPDLKVVLETALEKDCDHRYQTALDLAEEISRIRRFEPIRARPAGPLLRLRRWSQRNPALALATFGLFLALAAGLTVALALFQSRDKALRLAVSESSAKTAALANAESERNAKDAAFRRAEGLRLVSQSNIQLAHDPALALLLGLEASEVFPGVQANNALLDALGELHEGEVVLKEADYALHAEISADGRRILTVTEDDVLHVHDAETGTELRKWQVPGVLADRLTFSDYEGRRVQTLSADDSARFWDADSGRLLQSVVLPDAERFSFNADGSRLLTWIYSVGVNDCKSFVRLRDCATGGVLTEIDRSSTRTPLIVGRFSADDRSFAVGESDVVSIFDAHTGAEQSRFTCPMSLWGEIEFSSDNHWIAAAGDDGVVRLWDRTNGAAGPILQVAGVRQRSPQFSRDGAVLVTIGSDRTVRLWNTSTGEAIRSIAQPHDVYHPRLSADARRLLTLARRDESRVDVWDTNSGRHLSWVKWERSFDPPVFTPDGRHLLGGANGVRRWEATRPDQMGGGNYVRFTRDRGRVVAWTGLETIARIWDTEHERVIATLTGPGGVLRDAAFSQNGATVVTASDDGNAYLYDTGSGRLRATLSGHGAPVTCAAFVDDARIVTGSKDQTVRVWDVGTGKQVAILTHAQPVARLVASPDGSLVAASCDGTATSVHVWKVASATQLFMLPTESQASCQFALGGRRLVVSYSQGAVVFEVSTWTRLARMESDWPFWFGSGDDARWLVSLADDGALAQWDLETGAKLREFRGSAGQWCDGMAIGTSSRLVAAKLESESEHYRKVDQGYSITTWTTDPDTVRVWDAASGAEVATLRTPHTVSSLSIVDERYLITCHHDDVKTLWDVRSGAEVATFHNDAWNWQIAIAPGGRHLIFATPRMVRRYPLDPVAEARLRKPREFRMDELEQFDIGTASMRALARSVLDTPRFRQEIVAQLEGDESMSRTVRAAVIQEARSIRETPERWNRLAWSIVAARDMPSHALGHALRLAEAACRKAPSNSAYANTLGVARYRCGDYPGALEALQRSDALNQKASGKRIIEDVAFLAMAHHQLGHRDAAARELAEARGLIRAETRPVRSENPFLKEAEALIAGTQATTTRR